MYFQLIKCTYVTNPFPHLRRLFYVVQKINLLVYAGRNLLKIEKSAKLLSRLQQLAATEPAIFFMFFLYICIWFENDIFPLPSLRFLFCKMPSKVVVPSLLLLYKIFHSHNFFIFQQLCILYTQKQFFKKSGSVRMGLLQIIKCCPLKSLTVNQNQNS